MSTKLLESAMKTYKPEDYGYSTGGDGTTDITGDKVKDIDCSGLVSSVLRAEGYGMPFPYKNRFDTNWLRSKAAEKYFDVIDKKDVQPGDIVVWAPPPGHVYGHTGFVVNYDPEKNKGTLYGSNNSTNGPGVINIPKDRLKLDPESGGVKFLRPKSEYLPNYAPGPFSESDKEPVNVACASPDTLQPDNDDDYYFSPGMGM